jgi:hypothetical protein
VIGTQTRGALNTIDWYGEGDTDLFYLDCQMGLSKFTAASAITGLCTSYIYSYMTNDCDGQAVLFSDASNFPGTRLSRNEAIVDLDRTTAGWVPSTFILSRAIAAGETFWYGYNAKYGINTYYDVAGTFRKMWTDTFTDVPETFSDYGDVWSIIMSAYFSYTSSVNYSRTCTGNAGITGNTARHEGIARSSAAQVGAGLALNRRVGIIRMGSGSIALTEMRQTLFAFIRTLTGLMNIQRASGILQRLIRLCVSEAQGQGEPVRRIWFSRFVESAFELIERILPRMILKKEELIIVSRITREIEIRSTLV